MIFPFVPARVFTPANRVQMDWIVIHTMEAPETPDRAMQVAEWFAGPSTPQASAHYMVDRDQIVQSVREQDIAWQVQSAGDRGNTRGIGIEHAGFAAWTPADWSSPDAEAMLQRSAQLTADIATRWNIPIVWVDAAGLQQGERGITSHQQITLGLNGGVGHTDPGPNFPIDHYLALVRAAAGGETFFPATDTLNRWQPFLVIVSGLALGGAGFLAWEQLQAMQQRPVRVRTRRRAA